MNPNLNRSLPAYMPRKEALLIIWIEQFLNALKPMIALFQIEAQDFEAYEDGFAVIKDAYNCHIHSKGVAEADTRYKDLGFYDRNHLTAIAPRLETAIIPSSSSLEGGYVWRLVELIDGEILPSTNCTEDIKRQLQILPPSKTAPDLISLSPDLYEPKFTGGEVVLKGHLPKPAKYWYIVVDRNDGQGTVEAGWVAGAKFTDHHELPDKPTTWTYTVELQDKNRTPIGKVGVVSVTVWKGIADQGPEGK
ncbi:MAG: hypothetical protein LBH01_11230 [Verrucomicrobiales bacterium]|jgi:hypothetical protein|nr:hypothetical protein [Verrucomicrobiales bacterium]